MGDPQNGWFTKENPIKIYDWGVPPFMETPTWGILITSMGICPFSFVIQSVGFSNGNMPNKRCVSADFQLQELFDLPPKKNWLGETKQSFVAARSTIPYFSPIQISSRKFLMYLHYILAYPHYITMSLSVCVCVCCLAPHVCAQRSSSSSSWCIYIPIHIYIYIHTCTCICLHMCIYI